MPDQLNHYLFRCHSFDSRPLAVIRAGVLVLVAVHFAGCGNRSHVDPQDNAEGASNPDKTTTQVAPPVVEEPKPEDIWNELIEKAVAHLEADELDAVQEQFEALANVYEEPEQPSEEQQTKLDELKRQFAEKRKVAIAKQREEDLAEAEKLMQIGKLTEALQLVNRVKALSPTDEQRQLAFAIDGEIQRRRKARRDLQFWIRMLGTDVRKDVVAAHSELLRKPETALGMLLEATQDIEKPILAANSLELLRLMDQPDVTLPAMIDVLKRTDQQEVWPVAVRELSLALRPGAGKPLLELALASELDDQRIAALTALSHVVDPPNNTLTSLLPTLHKDGTDLSAALRAAFHGLNMHKQYDLQARRGIDEELTVEQEEHLAQLPGRLAKLIETPANNENAVEVVHAAKVLAYATRQLTPQPLSNVKVLRAEAESEDGPATAVLDGVWNSVELDTMWRHTISKSSTITLDLGTSRTVVGIRIWNFNQASGAHRGWKEVNVYVSDSPTEPDATARGFVPSAPGAADTHDYSALVPIEFVRGRYVRLQAAKLWNSDSHTGLSEIQVLGF